MYFLGFCALVVVASAFSIVAFFDPFIGRAEFEQASTNSSPSPTPKPSPAGTPGTGSVLREPESLEVASHPAVLPAHDTPGKPDSVPLSALDRPNDVALGSSVGESIVKEPRVVEPVPVAQPVRALMASHRNMASSEIGS